MRAEALEVKVNFRDELFERYREVIEERLEAKAMKNTKRLDEIPPEKFVGWSRAVFVRLRSLFQIFDRGGDGLIDFEELYSKFSKLKLCSNIPRFNLSNSF